jgi:hypothetical protein
MTSKAGFGEIYVVSEAMKKYGGSFVQQLAELIVRADNINLNKIQKTWPEYWAQYLDMANKDSVLKEQFNDKL